MWPMQLSNRQMNPANIFVENERQNRKAVSSGERRICFEKIENYFLTKTYREKTFGENYQSMPVN